MTQKPSLKALPQGRRRIVTLSEEDLVMTGYLLPDQRLPLVIQPAVKDVNLLEWATHSRQYVQMQLLSHGAILFRGFKITAVAEFEKFIIATSGPLLEYTYHSTPRTRVSGNIYTSTEYPANQSIPLHNEMSYASNWPMRICFCCLKTADEGGETPIADSAKVFKRISPEIRELFVKTDVMYVRNYGDGIDIPWQKVFGTTSKSEVEAYCREVGMEFEWKSGNRLRTRQRCQAVATHPKTGKSIWFNQAHLFHTSSLHQEVYNSLSEAFEEEDLPRNALLGDGSPIEPDVLNHIRQAYSQEETVFKWQEGDILMLDNMLVAHGRRPYAGARRVVVGMAQPFSIRN
jgi:alpha-ketoglutarate-dependent taurine dioxygenase